MIDLRRAVSRFRSLVRAGGREPGAVLVSVVAIGVLAAAAIAGSAVRSPASAGKPGKLWKPTVNDRWLYQIGNSVPDVDICSIPAGGGRCVKPTVWVLDLYAADGTTPNRSGVELVRRSGGRAVCYVSAGSWEQWRPDAGSFPKEVRGKVLGGWPGERWLDIRALGTLRPLLVERAKKCRDAGFRAIDWDNVDGYTNNSGFALDGGDQIAFATMLADIAHDLDLAVGLKNNLEQVPELVSLFDFAVNEQCAQFNECQLLDPFVRNAKVVVQIEYSTPTRKFCSEAIHARRTAMVMGQDLHTHPWLPCR